MTFLEGIKKVIKKEVPLIDVWHYLVGNYRYKLYYYDCRKLLFCRSPRKHLLMRQHIWEQIKFRIKQMNQTCFENGSCIKCGCNTTQLQMADKPCEGLEYPPMMSKDKWNRFREGGHSPKYKEYIWLYLKLNDSITVYKETATSYVQVNID